MLHRPLIFLGILLVTAAASADPAGSTSVAGDASAAPATSPAMEHRNCLTQTGSALPPGKNGCVVNNPDGSAYDQDDIRRTGATTVGGALQNLVPGANFSR